MILLTWPVLNGAKFDGEYWSTTMKSKQGGLPKVPNFAIGEEGGEEEDPQHIRHVLRGPDGSQPASG